MSSGKKLAIIEQEKLLNNHDVLRLRPFLGRYLDGFMLQVARAADSVRKLILAVGVKSSIRLGLKEEIISQQMDRAVELMSAGDLDRAKLCLGIVLQLDPTQRAAQFGVVNILREQQCYDLSVSLMRTWLMMDHEFVDVFAYMTIIEDLCIVQESEVASEYVRELSEKIEPHYIVGYLEGTIKLAAGDLDGCGPLLQLALEQAEEDPNVLSSNAQYLIARNERDKGIELLEKAIGISPNAAGFYVQLQGLKYYKEPMHPHISHLSSLIDDGKLSRSATKRCHYVLGDIYDGTKQFDKAFEHYKKANDLEYKWDTKNYKKSLTKFCNRVISLSPSTPASDNSGRSDHRDGPVPVFIIGMPRSGSTLVEQILASHPEVYAAGESAALETALNATSSEEGVGVFRCIRRGDESFLRRAADRYLEQILPKGCTKKTITDKQLFNFWYLGGIVKLFPNARVIHCRRNPLDTCLSCYFQPFALLKHMDDLETVAFTYKQYEKMMDHWRDNLNFPILEVHYEAVVQDQETWTRHILEFCGLPWREECIDFHLTNRMARTASILQVKRPIYSTSLARWKNYENHIKDLIHIFS